MVCIPQTPSFAQPLPLGDQPDFLGLRESIPLTIDRGPLNYESLLAPTRLHDSRPEDSQSGEGDLEEPTQEWRTDRVEIFAEADDPFDDFEEDDFDDDFDDDFEEDWEDDLTQDDEFPDTFGGQEKEDEEEKKEDVKKTPFKDDPDFDDK